MQEYLGSVKTEMRRVSWPTRQQTKTMSLVTIASLVAGGVVLWVIDTLIVSGFAALATLG